MSRSPALTTLLFVDFVAASVVEWRVVEVRLDNEAVKAVVLDMSPIDAIVGRIFIVELGCCMPKVGFMLGWLSELNPLRSFG
jgi:hypothetical protein